jgi:SWIM/SEC-C metal-binding protein
MCAGVPRFRNRLSSEGRSMVANMAKLGSRKRPAVVRVKTMERAQEIMDLCEERGWQVIAGVEPQREEDVSDVERLMNPPSAARAMPKVGRNEPCPCGSGLKYKRCCLTNAAGLQA